MASGAIKREVSKTRKVYSEEFCHLGRSCGLKLVGLLPRIVCVFTLSMAFPHDVNLSPWTAVKLKGLVDAAENYHTILVENRKLYNEVQDLKGTMLTNNFLVV